MLINTWIEDEYQLDISRSTNGSHVEVHGTEGKKKKIKFSLFVAIDFIYRFVLVQKL